MLLPLRTPSLGRGPFSALYFPHGCTYNRLLIHLLSTPQWRLHQGRASPCGSFLNHLNPASYLVQSRHAVSICWLKSNIWITHGSLRMVISKEVRVFRGRINTKDYDLRTWQEIMSIKIRMLKACCHSCQEFQEMLANMLWSKKKQVTKQYNLHRVEENM